MQIVVGVLCGTVVAVALSMFFSSLVKNPGEVAENEVNTRNEDCS